MEGNRRIKLSGEWTIERSGELKGLLLEGLDHAEELVVDCTEVSELDIACLQLLCATHRSCMAHDISLALEGMDSAPLRRVVAAAGYARSIGCHNDPLKSCLWTGGWAE